MNHIVPIIKRDLHIYFRNKSSILIAIIFFLVVTSILPIGIGPDIKVLESISPGLLWIAFFLSILLNINIVFENDFKDGSLDLILIESELPELAIISKIISFWLIVVLPLVIFLPLGGIILNLPLGNIKQIISLIIISSPFMILIASMGSAMALRVSNPSLLITILIIPFYIPILIFGTLPFIENDIMNFSFSRSLMLLTSASIFAIVFVPYLLIYVLKVNSD
ncbi:MAG: heme exporter protein CcmB [Hyphomicrobiales bacterium]|jgi:heme exporter protein B|nr:hypothetical protein [Alphaproteobacteria bacterium]